MTTRWLVTDVDGTITDHQGQLDLRAVTELRRLESRGISVGLISGRPYPMMLILGEYLGVTGPLIAENGGIGIYGGETFEIGSRSVVMGAVDQLEELTPLRPAWDNQWRITDYALSMDVDEIKLEGLVRSLELPIDIQVSSIMVHLGKRGINKSTGLMYCLNLAKIDSNEVVIVGDSSTDLPLFERFSVNLAPANCCKKVREIAMFCASSSYGKGFVEGVQFLGKQGYLP